MSLRIGRAALAALVVVFAIQAASAGESIFRIGAAYFEAAGANSVLTSAPGDPPPLSTTISAATAIKADGAASLALSFERRFPSGIGLELSASRAETGMIVERTTKEVRDLTGAVVGRGPFEASRGDMTIMPIMLALNVYLDNRENLDVLVGPVVGMVYYDDVRIPLEGTTKANILNTLNKASEPAMDVEVEDDFAYGLVFGIGTPIGESWEFRGVARWLKTRADLDLLQQGQMIPVELDIDPVSYEFTFGARF